MRLLIPKLGALALVLAISFAHSQEVPPPYPVIKPNQQVQVQHLPQLIARSKDPSDVLLTSLDIIFHDHSICCGRDSALEDSAAAADARSMKDIVAKLQGRHLLGDGRPVMVTIIDLAPLATRNPNAVVEALTNKHALLLMWKSHLYVLYGALYDRALYTDGTLTVTINKLYLADTRYSDSRRQLEFRRETDDWDQVEGLLMLTSAPE